MNRAVRIHAKKDLRVENLEIPEPEKGHVQLKMSTVGLCRTDVHLFDEGRVDHVTIDKPMIIGHEISGTVSKLGPGVQGLTVGDRVAIDPCRPCGQCFQCDRSRGNLCDSLILSGVVHCDGGFANYMTTPASTCFKLPEHVSLEEGAMMEPLSVGVNAVRRANMAKGAAVIVSGAGPIGLYAMQVARALGAGKVMMVDMNEKRLQLAKQLGADVTFVPKSTSDASEAGKALQKALGQPADLCLECSGGKGALDAAIYACRPGSTVVMVGFGEMEMKCHLGTAAFREIDVIGVFANANNYAESIELVAAGKVDVKSAISHRLPLEEVREGMELIRSGQSVKVVIDCSS